MRKRHILVFVLTFVLLGGGLVLLLLEKPKFKTDVNQNQGLFNWYSHGPGMGGRVPKVTVDQSSPNIIYAGHDVAGVSKSIDGGETWFALNNGLDNYDNGGVAVDYSNHNTIYTTTDRGLYKSTNGGGQWILKSSEIKVNKWKGNSGAGTVSVSQSKSNPDILYAISWEGEFYKDGSNYKYWIYKSTDHGESWTKIPGSDPTVLQPIEDKTQGNSIRAIMVDPFDQNKVYVGADKGLYRTLDGGANWSRVSGLDTRINYSLGYADGSVNINQLDNTSVIKKICQIDTTPTQTDPPKQAFSCNAEEPQSDCVNRCIAKYNPTDSDSPRNFMGPRDIRSIAFNPYNSNQIFALSAWGHIFKSDDGGEVWHEVYHRDYPLASAGHIDNSKTFVWNDRDWYGFDSTNYNSTYSRHGYFETIKIDANPDQANINKCETNLPECDYNIYVNIFSGESRSKKIWRINSSNVHLDAFSQPSSTSATIFGDNELWEPVFNADKTGGNLSRKDWTFGKSWQGFGETDMFDLDLSSSYPNRTIYAVGMWGAVKGVASEKYKTVGASTADYVTGYTYNYDWNWSWKGLDDVGFWQALYDPLDPKYIYFTAMDHGFIRSTDGGKTFERSISGVMTSYPGWGTESQDAYFGGWGHALAISVKDNKTSVYAGLSKWGYTGGSLFKSTDHGQNWTNISGTFGALNALPPELPDGNASRITNIVVDPADTNKIFITYDQLYSSHQKCIDAYETCKTMDDCINKYSENDLNAWKAQTCESTKNKAVWGDSTSTNVNLSSPIWMTTDGGTTWQPIKEDGLPTTSWGEIDYDSQNNILYYGTFDYSNAAGNNLGYGIYKLNLNNPTDPWSRLTTTITHNDSQIDASDRVWDVKIDPFNSNNIWAITVKWMRGTGDDTPDAFLIKSSDSGATWQEVAFYPETGIGTITFDPYREGRMAVNLDNYDDGGEIGVMLSSDGGATWSQNTNITDLITNTTAFHPFNPNKMVIGTAGAGLNWSYNPLKPADITADNSVDIFDLARFAAAWGRNGYSGDLNDDGKVDIFDLSIFSAGWGK